MIYVAVLSFFTSSLLFFFFCRTFFNDDNLFGCLRRRSFIIFFIVSIVFSFGFPWLNLLSKISYHASVLILSSSSTYFFKYKFPSRLQKIGLVWRCDLLIRVHKERRIIFWFKGFALKYYFKIEKDRIFSFQIGTEQKRNMIQRFPAQEECSLSF